MCEDSETKSFSPVEFHSKVLNDTQRRWPAHEKKMFALVSALDQWDCFLRGRSFTVITDSSLVAWMATSKGGKIARWAARLGEYDIILKHRAGTQNLCADFLSRYVEDPVVFEVPDRAVFLVVYFISVDSVITAQAQQPAPEGRGYARHEGVTFHRAKIWVPPRLRIELIEQAHLQSRFHHPGEKRTLSLLRKVFSWAGIVIDVRKYISSCLECQRVRPSITTSTLR